GRGGAGGDGGDDRQSVHGGRERDEAVALGGGDPLRRVGVETSQGRVGELTHRCAPGQRDQGPRGDVRGAQRLVLALGAGARGEHGGELLRRQGDRRQVLRHTVDDTDGRVDPPHADSLDQLLRVLD